MSKKQIKTNSTNKEEQNLAPKASIVNPINHDDSSLITTKDWIAAFVIMLLSISIYFQTTKYEFVNWDDDRNIFDNTLINQLTAKNFSANSKQIFKQKVIGNYNPLTIFTFALENKIYNTNKSGQFNGLSFPGKFHRTNFILHGLCVLLVYLISRGLGLKMLGAGLVALLFGLHPMRVESVAWVTERKDVLFGFFFLLSMLLYIRDKASPTMLKKVGIYVFFILSLFSKIQAVTLPLSLIAIDYLRDEKFNLNKSIINKIPFFLLSLAFGIYGLQALGEEGSLDSTTNTYPIWQRFFVGSYSFLIYLVKFIVPFRMSPMYPYEGTLPTYFYPTILMLPITLYALYKSYKSESKVFFFSLIFFIFNIVFLLQILGAGQGFIADRFTYIAYFGLFFGVGYYFEKNLATRYKNAMMGLAGGAVLAYGVTSFMQVQIWENTATLWGHVLKYYKNTTLPYGNRANYYRDKKNYELALLDYNSAIALKPEPQTHNSRARLFFDTAGDDVNKLNQALKDYNKAIELDPKNGEFWINRGATYARLADLDNALKNINEGLKLNPTQYSGYLNRFVIYNIFAERELDPIKKKEYLMFSLQDMDQYQKDKPYEANTWLEKARIKNSLGDYQGSLTDINTAISIDSTVALYYYQKAVTLMGLSNSGEAKIALDMARKLGYTAIDQNMFNGM
jgi:protein O-mannosyl-transferase